jgi:hypothetical protein
VVAVVEGKVLFPAELAQLIKGTLVARVNLRQATVLAVAVAGQEVLVQMAFQLKLVVMVVAG